MHEKFHSLRLEILGLADREIRRLRRFIREPYGMVLVTGPTGSGKTTTLYAALSEIKSDEDKIITIEDPVEYQPRGITQIPVNEKRGLTFARGLRSILRHDPDKIMVGEIRDNETAQIAIQSALTGHLVFTTVHANNVVDVLGRFLNMGVEPYNFVSALNCIMAQRLVRMICEGCKRPAEVSIALLEESGLKPEEWKDFTFYEGAGCQLCNETGFRGRTAIGELLALSDNIRELILSKRPSSEIRRAAHDEGMRSLRDSALKKPSWELRLCARSTKLPLWSNRTGQDGHMVKWADWKKRLGWGAHARTAGFVLPALVLEMQPGFVAGARFDPPSRRVERAAVGKNSRREP